MRKVKILPLLVFFSVMIVFVACGIDLGPESSNEKVLREHAEGLIWDLRLTCKYQEKCEAKITPFVTLGNRHVNMGYDRYEYEFDDGMTKKIVTMNTTVPVTVDDDDHVRFSLFDSARVEKTYDIDLSEIIHSYTIKDDSVEIKMPENNFKLSIDCPLCGGREYSDLCEGTYACHYRGYSEPNPVMVGSDSTWGKSFTFHQYLGGQSSMKADSIYIHGNILFR